MQALKVKRKAGPLQAQQEAEASVRLHSLIAYSCLVVRFTLGASRVASLRRRIGVDSDVASIDLSPYATQAT